MVISHSASKMRNRYNKEPTIKEKKMSLAEPELRAYLVSTDPTMMFSNAVSNSATQPLRAYIQALEAKRMTARYINIAKMLHDEALVHHGETLWLSCKILLESLNALECS